MHVCLQGRSQALETKTPTVVTSLGAKSSTTVTSLRLSGGVPGCLCGPLRSWLSPQCRKGQPGPAGALHHRAL